MYPSLLEQLTESLSGSYRIQRELGGGGMARVFLAEDAELGRSVVVKVLPPELTTSITFDRFRREMKIAATLRHPNIVPVLTAGTAGTLAYYTMPYIEGESLRQRLGRATADGAAFTTNEIIGILRDVASALLGAHERGIIHRDIKPENILVARDGALVTDFGIAKAVRDAGVQSSTESITVAGAAVGTPAYMAPEQAFGDPAVDHRVDIYAFGAVAYELVSGNAPFAGRTREEMLVAHAVLAPPPLAARTPSIPPELSSFIMHCLAKSPADRPQTAQALCDALHSIAAKAAEPVRRRRWYRRPAIIAAAAGAVLVAAAATRVSRMLPEDRARAIVLLTRKPAQLVANRYAVAPFVNHTGDSTLDPVGDEIADQLSQALSRAGIATVPPRAVIMHSLYMNAVPWPLRSSSPERAMAEESGAGNLVTGSIYLEGDTMIVKTRLVDVLTNVVKQPTIADVAAPRRELRVLMGKLQRRLVGTILFVSDTSIVGLGYSDAASPEAYADLKEGMAQYFRGGGEAAYLPPLRHAEMRDLDWPTPTVFLAYLDAWNGRPEELDRDIARATPISDRMSPAERAMFDYAAALKHDNLDALLPAAVRFSQATPGSTESPLLVSSTALGLRQPAVAQRALDQTDPDRGFNLFGGYYFQSLIGLKQSIGDTRGLLNVARRAEARFPTWILYRVYEARELARERNVDRMDRAIAGAELKGYEAPVARAVVAAHAASHMLMLRRPADAKRLAERWWPVAARYRADTSKWVQEAVLNLALIAERWSDLSTMTDGFTDTAGRPYFDRVGYAAIGAIHRGDAATAGQAEAILAATHPELDFGYRELSRACVAAHRGDATRAIALLEQAVHEGIRLHLLWGLDFMSVPCLAPLRGTPAFDALLPSTP